MKGLLSLQHAINFTENKTETEQDSSAKRLSNQVCHLVSSAPVTQCQYVGIKMNTYERPVCRTLRYINLETLVYRIRKDYINLETLVYRIRKDTHLKYIQLTIRCCFLEDFNCYHANEKE